MLVLLDRWWSGNDTSGTQGLPSVIPLVSKGRGEADGDNREMNFFLGIDTTSNTLAADFEAYGGGMNYPVSATTQITTNAWHHAAATYDSISGEWNLYLDGVLDRTLDIGNDVIPPARQHPACWDRYCDDFRWCPSGILPREN